MNESTTNETKPATEEKPCRGCGTPTRCEGIDTSALVPITRLGFTLRCGTPANSCECPDGACVCYKPMFLKHFPPPTGTLYQGRGVCREVAR